ncbi:FkbM family methyltransferase [Stieleria sp. TO1_6]|uniref:FkbM family methyltransferase n=1 Tax=Stieleria tagensis TaxID=2956795 RepID=UPI00209BB1DE|nr:FkbM family methyltransferase [Stieleria tagensis]MCO8120563.1 FkbM family methyltransferase [Stieleria tagensis]
MKRTLKTVYRQLFCNRVSYKFNNLLYECSLHGLGVMNYESSRVSGEAHFVQSALPRFLGDVAAPTFVDVGANVGDYTRMLSKQFPTSRIVSIEPHPKNFTKLQQSVSSNVTVVNAALGAEPGSTILFDRDDCDGSCHASVYEDVITDHHHQQTTSTNVTVDTLDAVVSRHGIQQIDLLKIDTEGHEREVLNGAKDVIASGAIKVLQIEFNALNVYSRTFLRDFRLLLPNFQFYRLLPHSMIPIPTNTMKSEIFGFQNVVCVRDDLVSSRRAA